MAELLLYRVPMPGILLIDDNANDLRVMRHRLERDGFQVFTATSGESGLELAQSQRPDCIMVDFRMPGMDGREVCRRVRADVVLQNIPIIMITGADQPEDIVEGINAGAHDYVSKSAASQVLLARVKAQLRVKTYQDQLRSMNQKMANDLKIARMVQQALLPQQEFTSPGIQLRAAYIPSELLSGDFYDYVVVDGMFYLLMADVSGHGLPAAILVSLLKTYLHAEASERASPATFMGRLNDFLFSASLPSQFATAQLFRFDSKPRLLRVSNAAHPPFLVFNSTRQRTESYEQPGHLLGALPGRQYDESAIEIHPGDLLFSYTDGLTDRRSPSGEFYSLERIGTILEEGRGADFSSLYETIYEDVVSFTPTEDFRDDVAFVLARFD